MENTTQYELRLAQRMSRLGTETAFEVLNKARALEKSGKKIIHLEIGEPDFDTPPNVVEAGIDACVKAGLTTDLGRFRVPGSVLRLATTSAARR